MNNKKIFYILLFIFTSIGFANAQSQLVSSYDSIQINAKQENKNILLVFSGSDWCNNCIRLKNNILSSEVFAPYAKENLKMYIADFPRKNEQDEKTKAKNIELFEQYNKKKSFPCLVLINPKTEEYEILDISYKVADEFLAYIKTIELAQ